eukprot:6096557-Ditylum_brightwellii.AAC.1
MPHLSADKEDRPQDMTSPSQDGRRRPVGYIMCGSDWTTYNRKKRKTQQWKEEERPHIMVCYHDRSSNIMV